MVLRSTAPGSVGIDALEPIGPGPHEDPGGGPRPRDWSRGSYIDPHGGAHRMSSDSEIPRTVPPRVGAPAGSEMAQNPPSGRGRRDPRTSVLVTRYGKFLVVGFTGVFVNLVVFVVTVDALSGTPLSNFYASALQFASKTATNPVQYFVGSAVAFGVATCWNYALNSVWTFRTTGDRKYSLRARLGLYFGVSLGSLSVNEVVLLGTETVLPPLIGQGIGIIAGSVVGFLGNNRYTFAETTGA